VPVDRGNDWVVSGAAAWVAAWTSTSPRPCACTLAAGSVRAVRISSALTWSGESHGRCSSISAAAPETTAAACDVPLPRKNRSANAAVSPYVRST